MASALKSPSAALVTVLQAVASKFGHKLELSEGLTGGVAIHKTGSPLPDDTLNKALAADATLLGVQWVCPSSIARP